MVVVSFPSIVASSTTSRATVGGQIGNHGTIVVQVLILRPPVVVVVVVVVAAVVAILVVVPVVAIVLVVVVLVVHLQFSSSRSSGGSQGRWGFGPLGFRKQTLDFETRSHGRLWG